MFTNSNIRFLYQDALPEVLPTSQVLLPEQQNNPQVVVENNRREETADLTSRDVTHEQRTTIDDEKECLFLST